MKKRKHTQIIVDVLKVLGDGKEYSYGELERKVNTNWQTIRDSCEELYLFDAAEVSEKGKIKITEQGKKALKKGLQKNK